MVSNYKRFVKLLDAQEKHYKAGAKKGAAKRALKIKNKPSKPSQTRPTPRPRIDPEEKLARAVLKAFPEINRGASLVVDARPYPRTFSGVFFLLQKGVVVYVGSGIEINSRVWECARTIVFDDVLHYPSPRGMMRELETAYIRVLRPKYNRRSLTEPPATDRDLAFTSRWVGRKIK